MIRAAFAALALVAGLASASAQAQNAYGGMATDGDHTKVYSVAPEKNKQWAEMAAIAECKRAGGKGCKTLTTFWDSCMVYARNSRQDLFPGNSVAPEMAAKKAMRRCTAGSPDGNCRLTSLPVCAGPGYSAEDLAAAKRAKPADIEALSAKLDSRAYWGAVAENADGGAVYSDGYPSEDEAINTLLKWEDCKDCRKLLTYKDTCVGIAWIKGSEGRGTRFTALNPDSVSAREASRETCTAKTGAPACVAMVRCSGRAYMDGYKGQDAKLQ
ncbi:DUF4189 domain-containing protein [Achromobacter sp.]|uniref:DUF4189 domain-containing protein n=1 Tax=Achromobacter sp. TaxID=134375 RepID=UPI0028AFAA04|nr:DUF4189 domain-containing protein [Achromobacter sp.]